MWQCFYLFLFPSGKFEKHYKTTKNTYEYLSSFIKKLVKQLHVHSINNIASCAIWLCSMVSYIKGGMQAKGIWKQDPEANIRTQEGWEWGVEFHNKEFHSLYRSSNIVRVNKSRRLSWAGPVVRMEEGRRAFTILTGKPTGKRPLGKPRRRWEDNIRMNLWEIGINTRNWVDLA